MFRALALGLAHNKKKFLTQQDEEKEADMLRLAVGDCICRSVSRRHDFEEALIAIKMEGSIQRSDSVKSSNCCIPVETSHKGD